MSGDDQGNVVLLQIVIAAAEIVAQERFVDCAVFFQDRFDVDAAEGIFFAQKQTLEFAGRNRIHWNGGVGDDLDVRSQERVRPTSANPNQTKSNFAHVLREPAWDLPFAWDSPNLLRSRRHALPHFIRARQRNRLPATSARVGGSSGRGTGAGLW